VKVYVCLNMAPDFQRPVYDVGEDRRCMDIFFFCKIDIRNAVEGDVPL
jgi:hypothetical protein